jgi:signal transduction histidine kinase
MELKKETKHSLSYAFLYTLVTLFIVSIPIFAYLALSIEYSKYKQEQELIKYADELEQIIYKIPKETKVFVFPRSLLYRSAILDSGNREIFSLLKDEKIPKALGVETSFKRLVYKQELSANLLSAKYLIVTRELSYKEVFLNTFMLIAIVGFFVFGFSLLILVKSSEPFREAAKQMDRFFKDAMHELKTPLGVIKINLEMLYEEFGEKRALTRANSALVSLSTVYEDIEYLIKHKRVEYAKEIIDFSGFLESRVDLFKDLISIKKLNLQLNIKSDISLYMNRQELQRVIDNTLSNAIKYTPSGGQIKVSLYKDEESTIFKVEDSGVGIEDSKDIFQRYYRGDAIKGGFGIGLNIVKKICEKSGIVLKVDSKVGKGSSFCYTFT